MQTESNMPETWVLSQLGDICQLINGDRGKNYPSKDKLADSGFPFVNAGHIENGLISSEGMKFLNNERFDLLNSGKFVIGDILFCIRGSLGKVAINRNIESGAIASSLIIVRSHPYLSNYLVFHYLSSPLARKMIRKFDNGTAQPNLAGADLARFEFPLPPIGEQNRIVDKIEALFSELDNGVEALKTAREQLKVYRQAVLKHAFEGKLTARWRQENRDKLESPEILLSRIQEERQTRYEKESQGWETAVGDWEHNGKIGKKPSKPRMPDFTTQLLNGSLERPEGWSSLSVGQLNAEIFDGPFGSNLKSGDYVDSGVRVIRLENIGYFSFIGGKHSYITDEKYSSLIRHTVHAGDLIFSSFITEGIRVAILPEDIQRAINKADCFCIRLHGATMRNDFLAAFLSSRSAYKQIEADIHGVGRPRINTSQLKGFVVPVCSPDEQDEIMRQIEKKFSVLEHLEVSINEDLDRIETLRQSILEKAFSGRLVAQDPNDESATTMLERIRLEKKARQSPGKSRKVGRRKLINNGKEKRNATLQSG